MNEIACHESLTQTCSGGDRLACWALNAAGPVPTMPGVHALDGSSSASLVAGSPEDRVVIIHYHRADGEYDGWGLHVWESFQKKDEAGNETAKKELPDRRLRMVDWLTPMMPAGKDDFGVYWLLDAGEFDNGRVNYVIHLADRKDQCNRNMFWLIKDGREIWVNAGDCNIYMSKEEATRARK